ncbi:MAG TPA: cobalamin-binding protein [Thermoanaerobaculia bacterium]|nr:cobalamin-binding protein [Thermoanaerobaculia bacterium]
MAERLRIVSLVPNGTEILFALGAGDQVVGVSHECDFPAEARRLPILTGSALAPGLAGAEIDAVVSAQLAGGESLYTLDEARIVELAPDLIVTQSLCPVCAVSTAQVDAAVGVLPRCPELLSLDPHTLTDVLGDIRRVGARLRRESETAALLAGLEARLAAVAKRRAGRTRPRVVALEWLDPPFLAGHWVPEMIDQAGGQDAFGRPGGASRRSSWEEIAGGQPDVVVVMPCGFDQAGAAAEMAKLDACPDWRALPAVAAGRAFAVDANGLFSRPGPRLVDGVERLAELFDLL